VPLCTDLGNVFRAGLRNGQQLSGRLSVSNNEPDKAAIVTIQTSDGRQVIEYYPRGAPIKVLQYRLDREAYAANPGGCQAREINWPRKRIRARSSVLV
jgi:hypothetical protein